MFSPSTPIGLYGHNHLRIISLLVLVILGLPGIAKPQINHDSTVVTGLNDSIFPGQTDVKMLGLALYFSGTGTDSLYCGGFEFNPKGTQKIGNILEARLYYQGSSVKMDMPLDTANQVGDKASISSAAIQFNDSLKLVKGVHYFVLAFDVSDTVKHLESFEVVLESHKIDGQKTSPTLSSGSGTRVVSTFMTSSYCSIGRIQSGTQTAGPSQVKFGNRLNNYSSNQDGYLLFGNRIPVLKSSSYELKVRVGPLNSHFTKAWIDWDGDGFFESGELVLSETGIDPGNTVTTTVTVPCFISPGPKRLRVVADYNSNLAGGPCDSLNHGSAEDYILDVLKEAAVIVAYERDTTVFIGGQVILKNTSIASGQSVKYGWDVDDDSVVDTITEDLTLVISKSGYQRITLKATLKSCDQQTEYTSIFTDSILVKSPTQAPKAEFVSSANLVALDSAIYLTDLTENGPSTWKWIVFPALIDKNPTFSYVSGSSDSAKQPALVFHKEGRYSITLVASNSFGRDTTVKVNYIKVQHPISLCGKEQNHGDTVLTESGVIYDDGGPDDDYGDDLSCSLLIQPLCADKIHLDLDLIDISRWTASGNSGDWLRVYDGTSTADSSLHTKLGYNNGIFNPNNSPSGLGSLTANSGSMLLHFVSDDVSTGEGFELRYRITPKKISLPTTLIEGPDTVYINSIGNYACSVKAQWIDKVWDFNGDGIPDKHGTQADFVWNTIGSQRIALFIEACDQRDTLYRTVQVVNPASPPVAAFSIPTPNLTPEDTLFLRDQSSFGPTEYYWTINRPGAYHFLQGTNHSSKHPILQFDSLGNFSINLWVKNSLGKDSLLKKNSVTIRNYCIPAVVSQLGDLGISLVSIKSLKGKTLINQTSAEVTSYTDFSKRIKATVTQGERYVFSIERQGNSDKMQRSIWMDIDQDGTFSKNERLAFEKASNSLKWTDTLLIPKASIKGLSRLRIGVNAANQTDYGCGPHLSGEFEDYGLIVVNDQKAPELTLKGSDTITIEQCGRFIEPGYVSFDNVQGALTDKVMVAGTVDSSIVGDYVLLYEVSDSAKNTTLRHRVIRVTADTTRPRINLIGSDSVKIRVFSSYTDAGIIAFDSCSGIVKTDTINNLRTDVLGSFTIVYRVQDAAGNRDSVTRHISVYDDETPVFSFLENSDTLYIEVFGIYNNQKWEAKDNYDSSPKVTITGTVNVNLVDTYYVNFLVTDSSGNGPTNATRVVFVVDQTKPEIILPTKQVEIEVGRRVNLPIPQITDNYDPNPQLEILGSYDRDFIGSYLIRYVATDFSKNVSDTVPLTVVVFDDIPPNIALVGAPLFQVCRWNDYVDPGVEFSDNYNTVDELTASTSYFNSRDEAVTAQAITQSPGYYSAYYEVEDESGNNSTITRIVQVVACGPTALQQVGQEDVGIYPNPANKTIFIESILPMTRIEMVDLLGREIMVQSTLEDKGNWRLTVANVPDGAYYLKLETKNGWVTRGIIIQH